MNMLKSVTQLPFVQSAVLGQARLGAAAAAAYLLQHGDLGAHVATAHYTANDIAGSICCLAAVGLTLLDNFIVHGKIFVALNTPVPGAQP